MVQSRRRPRLSAEAFKCLRICFNIFRQEFQGDKATEFGVLNWRKIAITLKTPQMSEIARFRQGLSCFPKNYQTSAAISIRRVARLSRNVGQPDHIVANPITSHKAERRPGSGEIWLAVTKHDGV